MAAAAGFAALLGLGGCSDDPAPSGATTTVGTETADTSPEPLAVTELDAPAPGRARVVLGADVDATLDVVTCIRDLAAEPDGEVPSEQVVVEAVGELHGEPLALDIRRYRSQGASPTITDTIRVAHGPPDAPMRVLEAQRFEVDGIVTDPRDPAADDPLLQVSAQRIEARAVFALPGAFAGDGGLVEGLVSVACSDGGDPDEDGG